MRPTLVALARSFCPRIQVKTYPFSSILRLCECAMFKLPPQFGQCSMSIIRCTHQSDQLLRQRLGYNSLTDIGKFQPAPKGLHLLLVRQDWGIANFVD